MPPGLADSLQKYNTVLIACGTPAASRWLPQAPSLPMFFATFLLNGKRGAMRCFELRKPYVTY